MNFVKHKKRIMITAGIFLLLLVCFQFLFVTVQVVDEDGRPVEDALVMMDHIAYNHLTRQEKYSFDNHKTNGTGIIIARRTTVVSISLVKKDGYYRVENLRNIGSKGYFWPVVVRLEKMKEPVLMMQGHLEIGRADVNADGTGLRFIQAAGLSREQKLKRCLTQDEKAAVLWIRMEYGPEGDGQETVRRTCFISEPGWEITAISRKPPSPVREAPAGEYVKELCFSAGGFPFGLYLRSANGKRYGKLDQFQFTTVHGASDGKPGWQMSFDYAVQAEETGTRSLNAMPVEGNKELEKKLREFSEPEETAMLEACERFDREKIEELLAAGVSIDVEDDGGKTPLLRAVRRLEVEQVKYLLEKGADPEHADDGGTRPLHMVSGEERPDKTEIARLLLERKVDVNARENDGWTPLVRAVITGNLTMVKLLIEHGADVNYRWRDQGTPDFTLIRLALKEKHPELIPVLRQAGAKE